MTFNEMSDGVADAERTMNALKHYSRRMSEMLAGRLRSSDLYPHILTKLKKELQGWNMHTNKWNN